MIPCEKVMIPQEEVLTLLRELYTSGEVYNISGGDISYLAKRL